MKRSVVISTLLCALLLKTQAQGADLLDQDPDTLFESPAEDQAPAGEEAPVQTDQKKEEPDLVKTVLKKPGITIGAQAAFYAGYSPGLTEYPWDASSWTYSDAAVFGMSSSITLDCQISPEFRVLQKFYTAYPELDPVVQEFFADYSVKDAVYLRAGRQTITWGFSPNFPFTNLTARVPDKTDPYPTTSGYASVSSSDPDSFSVKVDAPIGIGGLEALAFTRTGFCADPDYPALGEIGWGGKGNLALPWVDVTAGGFYLPELLGLRAFYSANTSLWKDVQLYSEGLLRFDRDALASAFSAGFKEASVSAGVLLDFLAGRVQVNGEYFYNGETEDLEIKNAAFPLFPGHNLALNLRYKTPNKKIQFFTQFRYNLTDNSGILIPAASAEILPNLSVVCALPCVLGSESGGYARENPDTLDRPLSLVLSVRASGRIQKDVAP